MSIPKHIFRSVAVLCAGLTLSIYLSSIRAADEAAAPRATLVEGKKLSLRDCFQAALEHQPAVAAAQASLAAAQDSLKALENLRGPAALIAHDLSVRKQQACLGVTIAQAALEQTEVETAYSVTRCYLTVLYAQEQLEVAKEVVRQLDFYRDAVEKAVKGEQKDAKAPPRDWTDLKVDKITVYFRLAENKQSDAAHGAERALAALREAMGLCPDLVLKLRNQHLFQADPLKLRKDELISLALCHRGEVIQTSNAVEVFTLEVDAQGKNHKTGQVPTFAAGGDIHAKLVPQGSTDGEYRPGGIPPEMPVSLAGKRCDRMDRARDFSTKSGAVADKTKGLVTLEVEDTFERWKEADEKVKQSRKARDIGLDLAKKTRDDFRGGQKEPIENVLTNEVLAAQARGAYNEALLQYLLTLAGLERATGGGYCARLAEQADKAP